MASNAFVDIDVDTSDPELPRMLRARVTRDGKPLDGVHVQFALEREGSFSSGQELFAKGIVTADGGYADVTWWPSPRYNPRRPLRSTVTATVDAQDVWLQLDDLGLAPQRDWR